MTVSVHSATWNPQNAHAWPKNQKMTRRVSVEYQLGYRLGPPVQKTTRIDLECTHQHCSSHESARGTKKKRFTAHASRIRLRLSYLWKGHRLTAKPLIGLRVSTHAGHNASCSSLRRPTLTRTLMQKTWVDGESPSIYGFRHMWDITAAALD